MNTFIQTIRNIGKMSFKIKQSSEICLNVIIIHCELLYAIYALHFLNTSYCQNTIDTFFIYITYVVLPYKILGRTCNFGFPRIIILSYYRKKKKKKKKVCILNQIHLY